MNILFLGYWNLHDPLTKATIFPHLKILQEFPFVEHIVFANTEREDPDPSFEPTFENLKISYAPLISRNYGLNLFTKIGDFLRFPNMLYEIVEKKRIDMVIARGTPAGALAYLLFKKNRIPFLVESFEPHADYMLESNVWKSFDPRYMFQKYWEKKQKECASAIMPVSQNYARKLREEGANPLIVTVPCAVDVEKFSISIYDREQLRKSNKQFSDSVIGVYAGRFGGLYLEEESFTLYKGAFASFSNFYLIILSPEQYHLWIANQIKIAGLPDDRILVKAVEHHEVPYYFAISDFAFATYKTGKSKAFLSPVKIGEYWAAGLPVVLTEGVGDEDQIIKENPAAGVLLNPNDIKDEQYLQALYAQLHRILPSKRESICNLARKHRSFETVKKAYYHFFQKYVT
jgi:glycosyltransferase involved in cell wall biosynthesis